MLAIAQESSAALWNSSGHLTLLRVHDVGTGFGPPSDFLNVEVVIQLDSVGGSFGFQLRDDGNRAVRQGMLDLRRSALLRVAQGVTSTEELLRVIPDEQLARDV